VAAKLYVLPASHPCATVEAALRHKGVPFDRIVLLPVLHKGMQRARFRGGTVPGIVFEDGTRVLGSRPILQALEKRVPQPPLYPAAEDALAEVLVAEEWGDQVLQPLVRRVLWLALSRDPGAQLTFLDRQRTVPPVPVPAVRLLARPVAAIERRIHGVDEAMVRADLTHLPMHLDRVDGWIADGTLGGEAPNAADLQIASSVRLLLTVEDLEPVIGPRPAAALARRWFPRYPGRVSAGVLPASWLSASRGPVPMPPGA